MNYESVYDTIIFYVYGDSSPPSNTSTFLKGSEGLIAKTRKQLQERHNLWFMEKYDTITIVDGTDTYLFNGVIFDDKFKEEISLQYDTSDGLSMPLEKLKPGEGEDLFRGDDTSEYPAYYRIEWSSGYNQLHLYPPVGADSTLHVRYYAYLDDLSDTVATFDAYEDQLSLVSPYLIIYSVISSLCMALDYGSKAQYFTALAIQEEDRLLTINWDKLFQEDCVYKDI